MAESNSNPPQVSVILPVYNEAGHLADEVKRIRHALDESPYTYEILIIDDGSTDGSGEIAASIEGVRVLRFATNRGAGSARKYGTMSAKGEVIVWTDVDMTYPNDQIPGLVSALEGCDQVVGARTSERGSVRVLRTPAKWMIRRLASYLSRHEIPDLNSGFRAFRREVGDQFLYLLPRGFSCVTTITLAFLSNGYSLKYVPIEYAQRLGSSKFHWWADTQRYLLQIIRMILMHEPIRFFGPVAMILLLAGSGKLIYDLVDKDFRVGTNTMVILGVGVAIGLLGLIADLMVQLNKRRHDVMPATVGDPVRRTNEP
jgi:polyisoprenyl-phosphate glycosyltransferase